ncbi:hypothetical protein SY1_09680 [Fretibacterium fastidiosum]|uniref:Uncharacterized protein n=1 Tax=Fretibacterium fastidiosum TaxID=651822 RepID=A0AB94IWV8_9BACT|nr:hypothetical protein SY1_09680 [Fretibacterium fastidiosum]
MERTPPRINSLARRWIRDVISGDAGPPLGGSYLMPPSSGGLWDGVITRPSATAAPTSRLCARMAREMTGVGVGANPSCSTTSTPFAARTSTQVRSAGSDRAWVSAPM